ncbi:MAG: hypothetical protein WA655_23330, partial [Candidatus Korobacteraceae bacterium]
MEIIKQIGSVCIRARSLVVPVAEFEGPGFRDCVATETRIFQWDKRYESQGNQPRSGDICVSRGRKPAGKWDKQ